MPFSSDWVHWYCIMYYLEGFWKESYKRKQFNEELELIYLHYCNLAEANECNRSQVEMCKLSS